MISLTLVDIYCLMNWFFPSMTLKVVSSPDVLCSSTLQIPSMTHPSTCSYCDKSLSITHYVPTLSGAQFLWCGSVPSLVDPNFSTFSSSIEPNCAYLPLYVAPAGVSLSLLVEIVKH